MARKVAAHNFAPVVGKGARQYLDLRTNEIISRRQRDSLIAGTKSVYERKAAENYASGRGNKMARYNALVHARQHLIETVTGKKPTLSEVRDSAEMKKIVKDLRATTGSGKDKRPDNEPEGPRSRALHALGLRDKSWSFAVGDTPITKQAKIMREDYPDLMTAAEKAAAEKEAAEKAAQEKAAQEKTNEEKKTKRTKRETRTGRK
jgi:hypothetical protein